MNWLLLLLTLFITAFNKSIHSCTVTVKGFIQSLLFQYWIFPVVKLVNDFKIEYLKWLEMIPENPTISSECFTWALKLNVLIFFSVCTTWHSILYNTNRFHGSTNPREVQHSVLSCVIGVYWTHWIHNPICRTKCIMIDIEPLNHWCETVH